MGEWQPAIVVHAAAAVLVVLLGPVNLVRRRRDGWHRAIGRTWVGLMYVTCGSSFLFGLDDGFTVLHGLSVVTATSVTWGVVAILRGRRIDHALHMGFSYLGTVIAFGFAVFLPHRLLWRTATTDPGHLALIVAALVALTSGWVVALYALLQRQARHRSTTDHRRTLRPQMISDRPPDGVDAAEPVPSSSNTLKGSR